MEDDSESDLQSTCSNYENIPSFLVPSSLKRRGHQHHPRFSGVRGPILTPNVQQIVDAISLNHNEDSVGKEDNIVLSKEYSLQVNKNDDVRKKNAKRREADKKSIKIKEKGLKESKTKSLWPENYFENECEQLITSIDEGIEVDDEVHATEWSKLRCTSESVEVIAERETRRIKQRCADYPGLAFACSIFSSDTMMKFNIIRNELHNIMNTQLKRVNTLNVLYFNIDSKYG